MGVISVYIYIHTYIHIYTYTYIYNTNKIFYFSRKKFRNTPEAHSELIHTSKTELFAKKPTTKSYLFLQKKLNPDV